MKFSFFLPPGVHRYVKGEKLGFPETNNVSFGGSKKEIEKPLVFWFSQNYSKKTKKVLFSKKRTLHALYHLTYLTNMRHPYVWPTARLTFLISGAQLGSDIRIGLLSIGSHHTPTLWGTFARATVFVIAFTFRII